MAEDKLNVKARSMGSGSAITLLVICVAGGLVVSRFWNQPVERQVLDTAKFLKEPLTDEADAFLTDADTYVFQQRRFQETWLKDYDRYDIDTHGGQLLLTRGESRTAFDLQSLGSFCKSDSTWQWAWANPNIPEPMSRASAKLKPVGTQFGLKYLEEGTISIPDERFPQYLGCIALKVTQLDGIFWAPSGDMEFYFLISNPREIASDAKK